MAIANWGRPTLEVCKLTAGILPENPVWIKLQNPIKDSSKLTTEKGEKSEIVLEGGEIFASKYDKNKYSFECQIPVGAGDAKPIEDEDGVIQDEYALRLTPEYADADGWVMEKTAVSVVEGWDAKVGTTRTYTFDGLKPEIGKILKPYKKAEIPAA